MVMPVMMQVVMSGVIPVSDHYNNCCYNNNNAQCNKLAGAQKRKSTLTPGPGTEYLITDTEMAVEESALFSQ